MLHLERAVSRQMMALKPTRYSHKPSLTLSWHAVSLRLGNMKRILKAGANVVIHYSDKTKVTGQLNESFAEITPTKMRSMLLEAGYEVCEEDLTTMWHSSIIRFRI